MTVRSDILTVVRSLVMRRDDDTFSMAEVLEAMHRAGTRHADQTIRTHVGSVMCINAPSNHAVGYPDFERIDRGRFRLVERESTAAPTAARRAAGAQDQSLSTADDVDVSSPPGPEGAPPIDAGQLSLVVAALASPPLTSRVAATEAKLEGLDAEGARDALAGDLLSIETAVAAMAVRASLGRVSDLIHASVICAALPRILEKGERVAVRPSLASGNDPSRAYDLETDRRIAEFKVAVWQTGSNVMRKRALFADLVALAMDPRPLRKQLFVVGELPGRFLRASKSEAHMVLQRAHQNLRHRFSQTYGSQPLSVAEFSHTFASSVELIDLRAILPELT